MKNIEPTISKLIYAGTPAISAFLLASFFLDPVNLPKLLLLAVISIPVLVLIVSYSLNFLFKNQLTFVVLITLFAGQLILSSIFSKKAFVTTFYGENGRNTGLLTYLCLATLFLGALTLTKFGNFKKLLNGFICVSLINIIYSVWVLLTGKDPVPWSNPYKTILGTFGNPDFLSAFLGISIGVFTVLVFDSRTSGKLKAFFISLIILSIYLIEKTQALQGFLIAALSFSIALIIRIDKSRMKQLNLIFIPGAAVAGITALMGTLQIGPLQSILYKSSVTYRGEYWQAAWNMAKSSPILGVGLDSYGDLYRQFRDLNALKAPGVDVVTNTAHNVYLDILAGGGFPLFTIYLAIQFLVFYKSLHHIMKSKSFDKVFIGLFVAWVGYQAQSLISINQIGLAVWGWVLGGSLLAYCHLEPSQITQSADSQIFDKDKRKRKVVEISTPPLSGTLVIFGMCFGFLITSPLVLTEASWRHSLEKGSLAGIESTIGKFPKSTARYQFGIQHLGGNQLNDLAYKYILEAIQFNPNDYQTWRILSQLSLATQSERDKAKVELHRLDPNNPEWK